MLVSAPLVQAKQDGSIRMHYLTKVVGVNDVPGSFAAEYVPSDMSLTRSPRNAETPTSP
jgi:hypothetical protein